jgi:hypothetical protein
MILVLVRMLVILQENLDLIVHLMSNVLAAEASCIQLAKLQYS